jgi:lysosomal acid lipase/cholesteryl ester hydrolase
MKFLNTIAFLAFLLSIIGASERLNGGVTGSHVSVRYLAETISVAAMSLVYKILPSIRDVTGPIDPDVYMTPAEMVTNKGYIFEEHEVVTEDGYILTVWRVQKNVTRNYPVILQHGLLDCSFSWFVNQPHESLSYMLADAGYDVWVTNSRGTRYSTKHTQFTSADEPEKYWDFSWDEMAKYDLPANVEYVKKSTGANQVHYIGHSQGTTQWFAHMSVNTDSQSHFRSFGGLGPVISIENISSTFATIVTSVFNFLKWIGVQKLYVSEGDYNGLMGEFCNVVPGFCAYGTKFISGFTEGMNWSPTRMAVIASHEPGRASLRTGIHWMQMAGKGGLPMFDFGEAKNVEKYGQSTPPQYPVENLKLLNTPMLLARGRSDPFIDEIDFSYLLKVLPHENVQNIRVNDWGHLDYLWATNANTMVYAPLVRFVTEND